MNTDTAREDLAFMRSLVQPDEHWQRNFGEIYAAAGACYGGQMMMHGLQTFGLIPAVGLPALAVGFGPTLLLLVLVFWISRRNRASAIGGISSRTVRSVFSAIGIANFALIAIFASVAIREHSFTIWLIYAPVVLVTQGAAWLTAFMLRRKVWFGLVAAGWFATGIGMALAIQDDLRWFILIGGVGFFAFMLAPGLVMMRRAAHAA
jgi:hypothetical protein